MLYLGGFTTCVLNEEDDLQCFGSDEGSFTTATNVLGIVAIHALGVGFCYLLGNEGSDPGSVYCWGANNSGQLVRSRFVVSSKYNVIPMLQQSNT